MSKVTDRHAKLNGKSPEVADAPLPEIVQAPPSPNVQQVERTRAIDRTKGQDKLDMALETTRYVTLAAGSAMRMGVWVPCTLPEYEGLSVLFRTNNATKMRMTRPDYFPLPLEMRAIIRERERVAAKLAPYKEMQLLGRPMSDVDFDDLEELEDRDIELVQKLLPLQDAYNADYHHKQAIHISKYVIGFEGWAATDIPEPDPETPLSFVPLADEMEDLYTWLVNDGYTTALRLATKNS